MPAVDCESTESLRAKPGVGASGCKYVGVYRLVHFAGEMGDSGATRAAGEGTVYRDGPLTEALRGVVEGDEGLRRCSDGRRVGMMGVRIGVGNERAAACCLQKGSRWVINSSSVTRRS